MRIGIDISKAVSSTDGVGRYGEVLLRGLMSLDPDDEVVLYGLFQPVAPEAFEARFGRLPEGFRLAAERRPGPAAVDVFHATTHTVPPGLEGGLVFTVHDLTFLSHPRLHTLDNRLHCLRGLAYALSLGTRLIAVSENTRRDLVRLLALDAGAIAVVHNAAADGFRPASLEEQERVRTRYGLDRPFVLSVGVQEPRKNLATLLEAFRRLPEAMRRDHLLALAGPDGWLLEDLRSAGAARALGDQTRWLGRVPEEDLPPLYSAATAFAYPSLYEGFGLPLLEAMACGAPVVASRTSSIPEVTGEAAVLVDPLDADSVRGGLAEVLGDADRRRALAAAGLERATHFSAGEMARKTLAVYRRAAAAPGASR